MPRLTSIAIIGVALAASGCGIQAATPPKAQPEVNVPELTALSSEVPAAIAVKVRAVARNSAERRARELTVRVRNLSCDGVATGSGFAIARDLLGMILVRVPGGRSSIPGTHARCSTSPILLH